MGLGDLAPSGPDQRGSAEAGPASSQDELRLFQGLEYQGWFGVALMGSDPRIGYQFIYPGAGYGGSCFPKDVQALDYLAKQSGTPAQILPAVHNTNERQKQKLAEQVIARFGADLTDRTVAVWGLSFKPNTDDLREAPSRVLSLIHI